MELEERKKLLKSIRKCIKDTEYPAKSLAVADNLLGSNDCFNCYGYLFGFTGTEYIRIYKRGLWNLGYLCDTSFRFESKREAEEILKSDFEILKLKLVNSSEAEKLKFGELKFAMYYSDYDFHFVRQNADGTWSHKVGWERYPESLRVGENGKLEDVLRNKPDYELVGIYKVNMREGEEEFNEEIENIEDNKTQSINENNSISR